MKSRDAVVLSADVFGYTRLVNDYETETLERLVLYHKVFRRYVGRAGGRIFNYAGDAVLAEFPTIDSGLVAAVKIQQQIRRRNLKCPLGQKMLFRMGINVERVFERGGDLLGDTVNIAARLQAVAEPGGICVSEGVYLGMSQGLSVSADDVGMQSLKNIPASIQAYTLSFDQGLLPRRLTLPIGLGPVRYWPRISIVCSALVSVVLLAVYGGPGINHPAASATASVMESPVAVGSAGQGDGTVPLTAGPANSVITPTGPVASSRVGSKKADGGTKPDAEAPDPVKAGLFVGSFLFGGLAALSAIDDIKHGISGDHATSSMTKPNGAMTPVPIKESVSLADPVSLSSDARTSSISRCKLVIAQQTVFDTGCEYSVTPRYTTFEAPSINGRLRYLAKVNLNPDRTGDGFLRGGTSSQERSLGPMTRNGACWINADDSVQLCAWK